MAAQNLDWVLVYQNQKNPIGAIGFIGDDAAAIAAFYDDRDGNHDGEISVGEHVASLLPFGAGRSTYLVAMHACDNLNILKRDTDFANMANKKLLSFGKSLVLQGVYAAYFSRGVKMTARGTAQRITKGKVKELVVRKGFETAVKEAFNASTAL